MDIPGLADAMENPELREKAEKEAERLLDELKKEVKATLKDIGVLRKQMAVTVPAKVIANHITHNFDELVEDAVLPGFRKGRAPRQLIEKRFGSDVRESLKTSILGQSFYAAAENAKLEVLGDPLFEIDTKSGVKLMEIGDAIEHIALPDKGDFTYTCEIEVKPEFELPELKGIEVKSAQIEITPALIDEHILRQRKIRGRYEPSPDGAAEGDDLIVADVTLTCDGQTIKTEENLQLGVRATRLDGIHLPELDKLLLGVKAGDTRASDCTISNDYERSDLRGKPGRFEFKIHEVKRLVPLDMAAYIDQLGCSDEKQLREFVAEDLDNERATLVQRAKKEQVFDYLLEHTKFDLPRDLSARLTDRAVMRRVVDLQQRGVPWSDIEAHIDELRTTATSDVARDLKLEFILAKVAEKLDVAVAEEEVNTEIARIARMYNRRFDRVRDEMQQRGLLMQLGEQIRQDKCVALLLKDANIVEVKPEELKARAGSKKKKSAAASE